MATTNSITPYDATADIKALGEAQKSAQLAGLQKANQSALSNLGAESAKIAPEYYDKRNATATGAEISKKNFAEYMAQRGSNNATGVNGTMAQNEISSNVALQGNLGKLNTAEAGANADIARRTTDVNNGYASDIASANATVDANTMQALISAQQKYNDTLLNQSNLDRTYNYQTGRDTVADTRYNTETAYNQGRDTLNDTRYNDTTAYTRGQDVLNNARSDASLTGILNGQETLAKQQLTQQQATDKFNQGISIAGLTGNYGTWDEAGYLKANPDVAEALRTGRLTDGSPTPFTSAKQFYDTWGKAAGRTAGAVEPIRTVSGQQSDAQIANTQANTTGQLIQNQYAPEIAQGQIDSTKTNTQLAKAELQEKTDPNSVTNQMARLGLDTAKLNYSYLPQQLQTQAQLILQQLAKGNIDIQTAQVQLNYLPQQLQTGIDAQLANIRQGDAQIEIARQNAANGRSGGGGNSGSSGTSSKASLTQEAWSEYGQVLSSNGSSGGSQWLESNKSAIIDTLGQTAYNEMVKTNQEAATQERSTSKAGSKQDTLDSRR